MAWSCTRCTLDNVANALQCVICDAARPWACPQCTLLNDISAPRCAVCDEPRAKRSRQIALIDLTVQPLARTLEEKRETRINDTSGDLFRNDAGSHQVQPSASSRESGPPVAQGMRSQDMNGQEELEMSHDRRIATENEDADPLEPTTEETDAHGHQPRKASGNVLDPGLSVQPLASTLEEKRETGINNTSGDLFRNDDGSHQAQPSASSMESDPPVAQGIRSQDMNGQEELEMSQDRRIATENEDADPMEPTMEETDAHGHQPRKASGDVLDPGLSQKGHDEVKNLGQRHAQALSGIDVAFVSPLYRAAITACVMLPRSTKIIFTRDLAELASDKFAKDGVPMDPKSKVRIEQRKGELTGRTRRELQRLLGDHLDSRSVEWDGIGLDDRWWDGPPETQEVAKERARRVCERVAALPRQIGVALVCHSLWLKVAIPYATRPKGTPNPLGTAAHYWPKNAVPYMGEMSSTGLHVLCKLTDADGGKTAASDFRAEAGQRRLLLLRHGHSQAQQRREEEHERKSANKGA